MQNHCEIQRVIWQRCSSQCELSHDPSLLRPQFPMCQIMELVQSVAFWVHSSYFTALHLVENNIPGRPQGTWPLQFGSFDLCRPVRLLGVQKLVDLRQPRALRAGVSACFGLISKTQGPHNAAALLIRGPSGRCQLWIVVFDGQDLRRWTCPPALKCYRTPRLVPQKCCSERHSNFELLLQRKYGHLNSGESNFCPSHYLCPRAPRSSMWGKIL